MNAIKLQTKINKLQTKLNNASNYTRAALAKMVIELLALEGVLEQLQTTPAPVSVPAPATETTPEIKPAPAPAPAPAPIKTGDHVHFDQIKIVREYPDGTYASCVFKETIKTVHGTVYATKGGKLRVKVEGEKPEDLYDQWGKTRWIKTDPPVQLEMWDA